MVNLELPFGLGQYKGEREGGGGLCSRDKLAKGLPKAEEGHFGNVLNLKQPHFHHTFWCQNVLCSLLQRHSMLQMQLQLLALLFLLLLLSLFSICPFLA